MTESDRALDSVMQRFEDSAEALERLKEHLSALDSAEEHQAAMSESITGAANQLQEMVQALGPAREAAQSTVAELRSAFESAGQFLLGTNLKAVQADIASLRQQTGQITEHLADELKQAQDDRDAAQVELAETSRQLAELEAKVAKMPERQQRKFGFI